MPSFDEEDEFDPNSLLPPFANEQNKILASQVRAKETRHSTVAEELEENNERVGIMADHLRNVEQEHLHTQVLFVGSLGVSGAFVFNLCAVGLSRRWLTRSKRRLTRRCT